MGPDYVSLKKRINDLLKVYIQNSGGLIVVESLNPRRFSVEEDLAVSDGVQSVPNVIDGSEIFLGLAGQNSTNGRYAISHFGPEREAFLEYDLTRLIYDLSNAKKRVVAIYGDLPLNGDKTQRIPPWTVVDAIERFYETQTLFGTIEKFSDDIDVLLLAEPTEIDEATLYAIDQFVMRGGRILAFIDPFAEAMNVSSGNGPQPPRKTSVETMRPLFKSWGVEIVERRVVGDLEGALKVQMTKDNRIVATEYPAWFDVRKDNFLQNDILTSNLTNLSFRTVGYIKKVNNSRVNIEPLVWSSRKAGIIDVSQVEYAPDPTKILSELTPRGQKFTLVGRVKGAFNTAFVKGPPQSLVDIDVADEHKEKSAKSATIIIVADSDFLSDRTWIETSNIGGQELKVPFSNNGDLVLNALDSLTGSSAMMGLRGRGISKRRFDIIDNMESEAEKNYRSKERALIFQIKKNEAIIAKIQKTELKKGITFTKKQQQEIDQARDQMLVLRTELRNVQFSLREDIEGLKSLLSTINIWVMPVLIGLLVIILIFVRTQREKRFFLRKS
jgi:ABC-type uncharacterized transport system involved in gliding motility auxiliary subunit